MLGVVLEVALPTDVLLLYPGYITVPANVTLSVRPAHRPNDILQLRPFCVGDLPLLPLPIPRVRGGNYRAVTAKPFPAGDLPHSRLCVVNRAFCSAIVPIIFLFTVPRCCNLND